MFRVENTFSVLVFHLIMSGSLWSDILHLFEIKSVNMTQQPYIKLILLYQALFFVNYIYSVLHKPVLTAI